MGCLKHPFVDFASFSACDEDGHDGFRRQGVNRGRGK